MYGWKKEIHLLDLSIFLLNMVNNLLNKVFQNLSYQTFLMTVLEKGKIIGYQGKGKGRPIYEVIYNGKKYRAAITVGKNGFIVGA
ncbi:hypothetical protein, partial [Lactiplantibacillus plantarum]|uniref:hypothetical protein n=1 Tax=Lactiplantibacillus plantarum TaxID=1590 RepID=UPI000B217D17